MKKMLKNGRSLEVKFRYATIFIFKYLMETARENQQRQKMEQKWKSFSRTQPLRSS